MTTTDALEQQKALYGAPLAELGADVMRRLGLNQGRLAEALGLSAPMLSQLMSGQRVKIGNPAVVHRLQMLLDLSRSASTLSADEIRLRLAAVREEQLTLTGAGSEDVAAVRALAAAATAQQLESAARSARSSGATSLAELLHRAAGAARG